MANLPLVGGRSGGTSSLSGAPPSAASMPSASSAAAPLAVQSDDEADPAPQDADIVKPQPWAETVTPMAPTWCEGAKEADKPHGVIDSAFVPTNMKGYVLNSSTGEVGEDGAALVAWSACMRPNDKNRQKWIASYRQEMLNTSGMTEAENREYLKVLMMSEDARQKATDEACDRHDGASVTTAEQRTQKAIFLKMLGCKAARGSDGKDVDVIDQTLRHLAALPEITSHLARASFVRKCVGYSKHTAINHGNEPWLMNPNTMANYAFCAHDIAALDRAKFHKELDGLRLTPVERVAAIRMFALTKWITDWQTAEYQRKASKSKWIKEVVFDAPREGYDAWTKLYKANAASVDMARSWAFKYDMAADSKSKLKETFSGCAAPLRKALSAYVKSKKPKSPADVREALADGVGYPLVVAGAACEALQGQPGLALGYKKLVLMKSLGTSGPRHEAYKRAVRRVADLAADQENFPMSAGTFNPSNADVEGSGWAEKVIAQFAGGLGTVAGWTADDKPEERGSSPDGVIKSVTSKDGGSLVEFKTEKWQEAVFNCTPTNKVDRIDFSGGQAQVIYQQNCKFAGMEPRSFTLQPVWVPGEFASGLRPGLTARVCAAGSQDERAGFIVEAYGDQQRKSLVYSMVGSL